MKPKDFFRAAFSAALFALALNLHADGTNQSAAQAWMALTNYTPLAPPMEWQTNPPTQEQLDRFDGQQAAQVGAVADAARDFYMRFPDDLNAARARTTEIQALQMAVHFGATNRLDELLARERAIIADTNAPEDLRYELRVDEIGHELQSAAAAGKDTTAEMEKAGRALVKEFPDGPLGYELLINVAMDADLLKMHDLAELMANSGGPSELTNLGSGLLHQLDAVGKPLPLAFTAVDGREINRTTLSNQVVVVDFWATWCPNCVEAMPELKKLYAGYHAKGLEIVGVDFDEDQKQLLQFVKEQDITWPQYFGGYGADNPYGREYGEALPYIWLVDKRGIVCDIHGRVNLEAKVEKLLAQ
jgi:thiol-disulfide isomerase/thioredoxin